jgi:hypothetical protein
MATVDKSFRVKNGAVIEGSSGITAIAAATQDALIVTGRAGGSSSRTLTILPATLSGNQTITFPDATGTVALTANKLSVFAATTSSELAGVISDETGTGALVFANTPTLVTPVLGVATATSINKVAITAPASAATLTIADGKTLTASNTLTFTGTDTSSVAFGTGGTVAYTSNNLGAFGTTTSAQLAGIISDETGSGALVFGTSPSLTTPNIGVATGTSFNSITGLSSTTPVMNGTAAVGTGTTAARADHVHASDTSRAPLNNPTFTGTVTLAADPTLALQAATKQYVDNAAAGLNAHGAVAFATTAALGTTGNLVGGTITTTYANGSSGVGATLTIATSANWTAITIDGQSLVVNDRVLIKNQAASLQNGLYTVTSVGALANTTSFVFTRAEDQNTTPEMAAGDLVYVTAGTSNGTTLWVETAKVTAIGTDPITWSQFSGASTATAGAGLVQNGNAYDVAGTTNRITVNADSIDIASTYVGQTSITTLGTIGTGVWQGTLIGATYGGTGVNNGSNTITLGGNISTAAAFTTSGANALTLTTTGSTNVTLPTSGTLLTTAGSGSSLTFGTGTLSLAGNVTHSGSFTQTFTATGNTSVTLPTSGTLATLAGTETLTNKVSVGLANGQISSSTVTCATAGTGYTLDTFAVASFTSAKYMVQGTSGNERELTELLVTVNAADVHIAEYGNVMTSGDLFTITATLAAGTVTITVTPTTGNGGLVAKAMRTVIAA